MSVNQATSYMQTFRTKNGLEVTLSISALSTVLEPSDEALSELSSGQDLVALSFAQTMPELSTLLQQVSSQVELSLLSAYTNILQAEVKDQATKER